jgi:GNAT superfamily N-acetyltransferase
MVKGINRKSILDRWSPTEVTLQDGRRVLVRPVVPADKDRIVAGLARMSERSRRLRFHSLRAGFSQRELEYLTELDYHDHFAWGAEDADNPEKGVAVARYIRDHEDPGAAEVAVTVVDDYQGLGLGETLLRFLAVSASVNDINRLFGEVLPGNDGALRLFRRLGGSRAEDHNGVQRVHLQLPLGQ